MNITRLNPDTLHKNPAFTQVAVVDKQAKLVYVGGQDAVNVQGEIVGEDIATQAEQAYKNVITGLEAAGASLADVFKITIYMEQGQSPQEAYSAVRKYQDPNMPPPTISLVMVAGLANPKLLIEIEAVAAID